MVITIFLFVVGAFCCSPGWSGDNCNIPLCLELDKCNGVGLCKSAGSFQYCDCFDGVTGESCETKIHGGGGCELCVEGECSNNCSCFGEFYGQYCNHYDCNGISYQHPTVCGGNGNCSNVSCLCQSGWSGQNCETPICEVECTSNHTTCITPNTCGCTENWEGDQCETPICDPQCQSGVCIFPNDCECYLWYYGNVCQHNNLFGSTYNTIIEAYECQGKCSNFYDCSLSPQGCSGHGVCESKDCVCHSHINETSTKWGDYDCSSYTCDSFEPWDSKVCSEHGSCDDWNTCSCISTYTGTKCQTPVCNLPCIHGNCTTPGACSCQNGWEGDQCDTAICDLECLNGGICSLPNTCECVGSYTGNQCETFIFNCFGILQNDEKVCNGHGECEYDNGPKCNCFKDYFGANCSLWMCDITICFENSIKRHVSSVFIIIILLLLFI